MVEGRGWFSESLARGLLVIKAFGEDTPRLRISDVATLTGLPRAAARRYLLTLRDLGYLGSDGDHFFLRPRVLDLGYSYISSARIEEFVDPILKDLADRTDSATHFAVFDNNETFFVGTVYMRKMHGFFIGVGARRPAYAGSLGHALLSGLPEQELETYLSSIPRTAFTSTTVTDKASLRKRLKEVREQGYAINNGEHIVGVVGVAVPVRDRSRKVVAAINLNWFSSTSIRHEDALKHLPLLQEAVADIEKRISVGALRAGLDGP